MLAEVSITVKKYVEALIMFVQHGNLSFSPDFQDRDLTSRMTITKALSNPKRECVVQSGLHSDLVQKIAIVLIHLEAFRFAEVCLVILFYQSIDNKVLINSIL